MWKDLVKAAKQEKEINIINNGVERKKQICLHRKKEKSMDKLLEQKGEKSLRDRVQESSVFDSVEFTNSIYLFLL